VIAGDLTVWNSHARIGADTPALGLSDTGGEIDEASGLALDDEIER
jgi:hypothetical protein